MAKRFSDLKISLKLITGFSIVILCTIIIGTTGLFALNHVDQAYNDILNAAVELDKTVSEAKQIYSELRRHALYMGYVAASPEEINDRYLICQQYFSDIQKQWKKINEIIMDTETANHTEEDKIEAVAMLNSIYRLIDEDYKRLIDDLHQAALQGDYENINYIMIGNDLASRINNHLSIFSEELKTNNALSMDRLALDVTRVWVSQILTMGAVIICSIALALKITKYIRTPIVDLTESAKKIAKGDIYMSLHNNTEDEIGELSNSFSEMTNVFVALTEGINQSYKDLESGQLNVFIDETAFEGNYREVAQSVNMNFKYLIDIINDILGCTNAYANGDFSKTIRTLPGEQHAINHVMDFLRNNLMNVDREIRSLIENAMQGNLAVRIDEEQYQGDWRKTISSLNDLVHTVEIPVAEVASILDEVSRGNFSMRITGSYSGYFGNMKAAVNKTIDKMNDYIQDISGILIKMSNKDLNISLTGEYLGDFVII